MCDDPIVKKNTIFPEHPVFYLNKETELCSEEIDYL